MAKVKCEPAFTQFDKVNVRDARKLTVDGAEVETINPDHFTTPIQASYDSPNSFSMTGNQTEDFQIGRRVQLDSGQSDLTCNKPIFDLTPDDVFTANKYDYSIISGVAFDGVTTDVTIVDNIVTSKLEEASVDINWSSSQAGLITTTDLINSTRGYPSDYVLETSGFTTPGDGGGGKWIQNGVIAQTPSQTPADLVDGLLNDASGNQWALVGEVTTSSIGGDFLIGDVKYKVDEEGFTSAQTIDLSFAPSMDDNSTWADLYNNGAVTVTPNFYSNLGTPSNKRFSGRVMVGEAASKFAGDGGTDTGTSWLSDQASSPAYLAINSHLVVTNDVGNYAATFGVRSLNNTGAGAIAVGSAVVNDKTGGRGWGIITELQHEEGAWVTNGFEVAAKNKSSDNFTYSPYNATFGVFGGRLVAGGDDAFGGSSTNPSTAGLIIINNTNTWNTGIVIASDAITGTDGTVGSATNGTAISMGRRHVIQWNSPEGTDTYGAGIVSTVTNTTNSNTQQFIDNGVNFVNSTGKQIVRLAGGSTTVNYIQVGAATTGSPVTLTASGDDTDISLRLNPKGAGVVQFGTHTAIGAETVTGYISIKDSTGVDRKVAIVS